MESIQTEQQETRGTSWDSVTGYMHADYAGSLAEFGVPRQLPLSGGWILVRSIAGFSWYDGMGIYPLFTCRDWSKLQSDFKELETELVSLAVVADPFGDYDVASLEKCFSDLFFPFKEHFVTDLQQPLSRFVSDHHARYARRALKTLWIERCENPSALVDDWVALYSNLVRRHNIRGLPCFSRQAFIRQLAVPGTAVFRALYNGHMVGMLIWYVHGDIAYYHLGAYSDLGYTLRASFGLFWAAMEYFTAQGLRWLDLGGSAGATATGQDGLGRFKQGWATGRRPVYFGGRIFRPDIYFKILEARGVGETRYFPAYRGGEFA